MNTSGDFVQIASRSQSYSTIQTYFLGAYNLTLSDYWFALVGLNPLILARNDHLPFRIERQCRMGILQFHFFDQSTKIFSVQPPFFSPFTISSVNLMDTFPTCSNVPLQIKHSLCPSQNGKVALARPVKVT